MNRSHLGSLALSLFRASSPRYALQPRYSETNNLKSPTKVVATGKTRFSASFPPGEQSYGKSGEVLRVITIDFGLLHAVLLIVQGDVDVRPNIDCIDGYLRGR